MLTCPCISIYTHNIRDLVGHFKIIFLYIEFSGIYLINKNCKLLFITIFIHQSFVVLWYSSLYFDLFYNFNRKVFLTYKVYLSGYCRSFVLFSLFFVFVLFVFIII